HGMSRLSTRGSVSAHNRALAGVHCKPGTLSACIRLRPPPSSTLFPYTTLFRSHGHGARGRPDLRQRQRRTLASLPGADPGGARRDRKSTRLNSSHVSSSYAVFCLKKNNCDPVVAHRPAGVSRVRGWVGPPTPPC